MKIIVLRSYLTRVIQEIEVEIPDTYDVDEWMENDFGGFDQFVCDNGVFLDTDEALMDDDDLELEVVSR